MKIGELANVLLFLTKNIKKYIRYYDENEFELQCLTMTKDDDGNDGRPIYQYSDITAYVLENSLIAKKYGEDFNKWFVSIDGVDKSYFDKFKPTERDAMYKNAVRDINVTIDQIKFLYFIKNWELDKNIHRIKGWKNVDALEAIIKPTLQRHATDLLFTKHQRFTEVYDCRHIHIGDNLIRFKNPGDSELIAFGITHPYDDSEFPLLTLIYTLKDPGEEERPFMFLHLHLYYSYDDTLKDMIDSTMESNDMKDKYSDFISQYRELVEMLVTYAVTINDADEQLYEDYTYKPAHFTNIKNQFKEIYIGEVR